MLILKENRRILVFRKGIVCLVVDKMLMNDRENLEFCSNLNCYILIGIKDKVCLFFVNNFCKIVCVEIWFIIDYWRFSYLDVFVKYKINF